MRHGLVSLPKENVDLDAVSILFELLFASWIEVNLLRQRELSLPPIPALATPACRSLNCAWSE
jgi:hypothetical protein